MEEKLKTLILAGIARGIEEDRTKQASELQGQSEIMLSLRYLGFSLKEIGQYFDRTRQWVNQLLPDGYMAAPMVVDRPDPDDLAHTIWTESMTDLEWWGSKGRLNQARLVNRFRVCNYSWAESREFAKKHSINKLYAVLTITFGLDLTSESIINWFNLLIENHSKNEILDIINGDQKLQVSRRLFDRYWSELGLYAKRRKRHKRNTPLGARGKTGTITPDYGGLY